MMLQLNKEENLRQLFNNQVFDGLKHARSPTPSRILLMEVDHRAELRRRFAHSQSHEPIKSGAGTHL